MDKTGDEPISSRLLRVEASPRTLNRLSPGPEGQQSAVSELLKRLNETLSEISQNKDPNSLEGLPRTRKSRLQFWSGEPGIGKTSTYLSVKRWFTDQNGRTGQTEPDKDRLDDNLKKQLGLIRPHASRIRWLEPLDLEPLSGRPNFLASVVVRIDKALNQGSVDNLDGQDTWISSGSSDFRKVIADFRQLKNEIALSWEGNLLSRGGALDPDVYASEVIRAENARLDVSLNFGNIITNLAECASGSRNQDRSLIFILPIDDFYIQPSLSLEILRLLRMISCAHLFVLMLGDMDYLETLSFGHGLGEFSSLMRNKGLDFLNDGRKGYICQVIENRAADLLHKLIPPNHVFRFLPMRSQDTLDCQPQATGPAFKDHLKSFVDGLCDEELKKDLKKLSLYDMRKSEQIDDAPWFVIHALEMTPRNVADLYQAITELERRREERQEKTAALAERRHQEQNEILKLISEQVERTLFESLPYDVANRVWSKMSVGWGSFYQRKFPADALELVPDNVETEKPVSGVPIIQEIVRMYVLPEKRPKNSDELEKVEIPPRARGWLAILYYAIRHYDPASKKGRDLIGWKAKSRTTSKSEPPNGRSITRKRTSSKSSRSKS